MQHDANAGEQLFWLFVDQQVKRERTMENNRMIE